ILLAPCRFAHALHFAAVRRDGEDLAMGHYRRAAVRRRKMERLGFVGNRYELGGILFYIGLDLHANLARFTASGVELPDAEVIFVNNRLAVRRDAGEIEIAILMVRHLHRL